MQDGTPGVLGRRTPARAPRVIARWLILPLLALFLSGPHPAARADDQTWQNLLQRASRSIQAAERERMAGRAAGAAAAAARARVLLEQADALRPRDLTAPLLGVQAAVLGGDRDAARLWLARYERRTPFGDRDVELHYARALVAHELDGRPDRAVTAMERLLELTEGSRARRPAHERLYYEALVAFGTRLAEKQMVDDAVEKFRTAARVARRLRDRGRELVARGNVGLTLLGPGQKPAEAEWVFLRLSKEDPTSPLWTWYLARARLAQERWADALEPLGHVVKALRAKRVPRGRRAELRWAWFESGRCHEALATAQSGAPEARAKALADAEAAYVAFTEAAPEIAPGWYRLGRLRVEALERPYEALPALEQAHALDPACDASIRLLLRLASVNGPPPTSTEADPAAAWAARRRAWAEEFEANKEAWAAERERRRRGSSTGEDGCP